MKYILIIAGAIILAIIIFLMIRAVRLIKTTIFKLPIEDLGYKNIPAIPLQIFNTAKTLFLLETRSISTHQAKFNLSNSYKIGDVTSTGYSFLYGNDHSHIRLKNIHKVKNHLNQSAISMIAFPKKGMKTLLKKHITQEKTRKDRFIRQNTPLQDLSLEHPNQASMSWTNYGQIYEKNKKLLPLLAATIIDPKIANEEFWKICNIIGTPFSFLMYKKISPEKVPALKAQYGNTWPAKCDELAKNGTLYAIDMSIFEGSEHSQVHGHPRFTPATITLLEQNTETRALIPFAVKVSGFKGIDPESYVYKECSDGAWLYALQASKTSLAVYGIWLGHVYQLHIVCGAMQMTMYQNIPKTHPLYELMEPISRYLMAFDSAMLLLWKDISPPTSLSTSDQFLRLINDYSDKREFFDDDPMNQLKEFGIDKKDFSVQEDWDRFPVAKEMLTFWNASNEFIKVFVNNTYESDEAVKNDPHLQKWMKESASPSGGNLLGLPAMETKEDLIRVLTSIHYKIKIHGMSRVTDMWNPYLSYTLNFPATMQRVDRPNPQEEIDTTKLLTYLPNTGSIGEFMNFCSVFAFSAPYETEIPLGGIDTELLFSKGDPEDPKNIALVKYRSFVKEYILKNFDSENIYQWPSNLET